MTKYEFVHVSDEILLVRWKDMPSTPESRQFIQDFTEQFDQADKPLYIISDLTKGHITDALVLRDLAALMNHKKYAGSTAFGFGREASVTGIFVGLFNRLGWTRRDSSDIYTSPEEAIDYLESLKPGVTKKVEWWKVFDEKK